MQDLVSVLSVIARHEARPQGNRVHSFAQSLFHGFLRADSRRKRAAGHSSEAEVERPHPRALRAFSGLHAARQCT